LKDITAKQLFKVDTLRGKGNDLFLKFEIAEVYKGEKYEDLPISELEFDGLFVNYQFST